MPQIRLKTSHLRVAPSLLGVLIGLGILASPAIAQEKPDVAELQRIIEAQQEQLDALQKQLESQGQMLQQLLAEKTAESKDEKPASQAPMIAGTSAEAQEPEDKVVTSGGGPRTKLAVSGHVNRMVMFVDDGEDTDTFHADNDNSESRVRFVGTAEVDEDLTLGGEIELSIAPNKSGSLDQLDQEENNVFDQRKTEFTLDSKRWGKLWFGKGETASSGTGTVDLSRTGVISYATIVDTAGNMIFRESGTGDFSDVRVFQAFDSFDGLSRRSRVRYDSPLFNGFRFSTSLIDQDRYDAAMRWGGQGSGIKAAAGLAIVYPNLDNADMQYNGSFSMLHEETGLNATLSFGLLERDSTDDAENYFGKVGLLKKLFPFGDTAFSIDYTRSQNLPTSSDDGYSYALAAVQQFDDYGSELFAIYRLHSLDRDSGPDVEDIGVVSVGARVKF